MLLLGLGLRSCSSGSRGGRGGRGGEVGGGGCSGRSTDKPGCASQH